MAFSFVWTLATVLLLFVLKVNSNPPVPVLNFEEVIIEGEDTRVTCTLPCDNCLNVNLTIKANVTFQSCTSKTGKNPNETCTLDVTEDMNEMEFICEAQFKTTSLPKKMKVQQITPGGNRNGRREPVLATILAMLMASNLLYYLY